jgi:phosphatidylinositol-3-phosphatase
MCTITRNGCARISRARDLALMGAILLAGAAVARADDTVGPVFVIAMENHNWTQPASYTGTQAIKGNPAAPFINSLVTPGNPNALYVSYANNYIQNVSPVTLSDSHPSEPNYIWAEAGTDFGITNDNDPFGSGGTELPVGTQNLSGLLQNKGILWRSYQEGVDLVPTSGGINTPGSSALTNIRATPANYTVPIKSFSGTSTSYTNQYNGSNQYNYAVKHNGMPFFPATSGGNDSTSANVEKSFYAPIEQLSNDLTAGTYAMYNWITPDQFNDMHTALSGGFTYHGTHLTGDSAQIAQGDNFLSIVVPMIEASDAFQNHNGTIIIWNDETEGDSAATRTQFDGMEIVISKLAKGNAYNNNIQYTHSSDLKTMQELFNVGAGTATGFLGDAANATDLSDLFKPGAIPNAGASVIPEPTSIGLLVMGAAGMLLRKRRKA